MPLPTPFVVKKGSWARASVASLMPSPVSRDRDANERIWRQPGLFAAIFVVTSDSERPTLRHGIASVHCEIDQSELKLVRINLNRAYFWRNLGVNNDAWTNRMPQEIQHIGYQFLQFNEFDFQFLPPGKREKSGS